MTGIVIVSNVNQFPSATFFYFEEKNIFCGIQMEKHESTLRGSFFKILSQWPFFLFFLSFFLARTGAEKSIHTQEPRKELIFTFTVFHFVKSNLVREKQIFSFLFSATSYFPFIFSSHDKCINCHSFNCEGKSK